MKSYNKLFSGLYESLVKDIVLSYPTIERDMEKDLIRLHEALSHEGISFLTISQPEMCTFFQKALASQTIASAELGQPPRGFGRKSAVDKRPAYLNGLLSLVFDEDGTLRDDCDTNAVFFIRQWLLMAKKLDMECTDERLETALRGFSSVDELLPDHHVDTWECNTPKWMQRYGHPLWGPDRSTAGTEDLFGGPPDRLDSGIDWELFRSLCRAFTSAVGVCDPYQLRPKHGPGAVADNDGLKYEFLHWPDKLQSIFPWDFFACSDFGLYKLSEGREPDTRELPSIVIAVPKTQKGPRIICKEPIAHQWIQGGIERWLSQRIEYTFLADSINFRDQIASQRAALEASRDGSYATVDLSAASDRISTRLVEYVFRGGSETSLLDALHACRSRYYRIGKTTRKFRKFSPMGSACTFPVQTIIFALVSVFAIMQTRGLKLNDRLACAKQVRVFGDDIIIPTDAYPVLHKVLTSLGLKVNESKSYHTGLFRESCGMDAFKGVNVTPAYVRQAYKASAPATLKSVVECSDNFFNRGLWHTSEALLNTLPAAERKLIQAGSDVGGAVSLVSYTSGNPDYTLRWNPDLQVHERRALILSTVVERVQSDGDAGLIQFFNEEPNPETTYVSGQTRRVRLRKRSGWVSV